MCVYACFHQPWLLVLFFSLPVPCASTTSQNILRFALGVSEMVCHDLQAQLIHTVFLHQTMQQNWNTQLQRFIDAHPDSKDELLQDPTALGKQVYQLHPEAALALQQSVNALKKFDGKQAQINRAKALFERMTRAIQTCDRVGGQDSEVLYVAGSTHKRDHEAERLRARYRLERARQRSRILERISVGSIPQV
jgi:hypothetical protein